MDVAYHTRYCWLTSKKTEIWQNIKGVIKPRVEMKPTCCSSWKSYSTMQHYQKSTDKIPLKNQFVIVYLILKSIFFFFFHWRAGSLIGPFFMFKVSDPVSVWMTLREWKGKDHVNSFCFIIIHVNYQETDIFINNWYFL